jgi:tyrosinase
VAPSAHGSDLFLPWHRAYLNEFEHALQSVSDVPVCLPYWNWALDSQAPEYSPILSPEYFGTNGAGSDGCVTDGQFAGWRPYYPEPGCLRRAYENDGHIGAFHSIEAVNRAISTLSDYTSFRKQLEGVLHPNPHMSIGGHMSTMGSPSDVVFWLHHAFIDQIWSRWQKRNGFGYGGNANDPMLYLGFERNYRPADVLDQRQLCYDYAEITAGDLGDNAVVPPSPPPPKTPTGRRPKDGDLPELTKIVPLPADQDDAQRYSSRDRSNLAALRYADPPSQEWCRMNNIPYEENQQYEQEYRRVYKELNSVKGYVSPCALMKRPTLHARIIQSRRVSSFYVDVPDVGRVEVGYKEDVAQADAYQAVANVNQRVYACSPDVELDPQEYRATVQKLIGPSAFSGAADPLRITSMDEIKDSANSMIPATSTLATVAALAVAGLAQMW